MTALFGSFSTKRQWRKTCLQHLWKPKLSLRGQTFLPKLIQSLQFVYFNGLLPCPLDEKVLSNPTPVVWTTPYRPVNGLLSVWACFEAIICSCNLKCSTSAARCWHRIAGSFPWIDKDRRLSFSFARCRQHFTFAGRLLTGKDWDPWGPQYSGCSHSGLDWVKVNRPEEGSRVESCRIDSGKTGYDMRV
jgi:hypothetical protein